MLPPCRCLIEKCDKMWVEKKTKYLLVICALKTHGILHPAVKSAVNYSDAAPALSKVL